MAAALAGARNLPRRSRPRTSEILRSRHVPLPVGRRPARRAPAGVHRFGHFLTLQAPVRFQRAASDGLRRLRSAGRTIRHPDGTASGRHHRTQHRPLPRTARQDRLLVRLGPRSAHLRPGLLQVDAVGLPENVRQLLLPRQAAGAPDRGAERGVRPQRHRRGECGLHRRTAFHGRRLGEHGRAPARTGVAELPPGLPRRHDGQLVPAVGYGAGQRRGEGRAVGARRLSRRTETHEAVAAARDGLCAANARRIGNAPMERIAQRDPA